jgi:AmmeMemoRadiSam system protein A
LPGGATRAHDPGVGSGHDDVARRALALAREAVEQYVHAGVVTFPPPDLPPMLGESRGVFVTLRIGARLRGCIGVLAPSRADLAHDIIGCAIAAAVRDPRFAPVRRDELGELDYEVDVLGDLEPASGIDDLDPRVYGVVVEGAAGERGVLLPGIDGVDDAGQQVRIAREKAGLSPDAPVTLSRFVVRRFRVSPAPVAG